MMYAGKKALVLGLGESGLAMARWLLKEGAQVIVADTRTAPPSLPALRALGGDVQFCSGPLTTDLLESGMLCAALSPGLAPGKELAELIPAAQSMGIALVSEIELFAWALAARRAVSGYAPRVLAITGTNGKTTVTQMTGLLCRRAGLKTRIAGNISPAVLDVWCSVAENDDWPDVWVLELSSFQLAHTHTLESDAATVLNLTQDHLDWHGDMNAYQAAKARIFGRNTTAVLNRDDVRVMSMERAGATLRFGLQIPARAGDFGVRHEQGMAWLMVAEAEEHAPVRRRARAQAHEPEFHCKRLMPADALRVQGWHNVSNALAALALCRAIDVPFAPLLHALREYQGEPHRVERVALHAGVEYIDDSKGTNVGATVAALSGLGHEGAAPSILLIAGGDGKGQDFAPLAAPVARFVREVFLIGKDQPVLAAALADTGVPCQSCVSLETAVMQAAQQARPGDRVLLSPACASLDMFRNYAHRAEVFCETVHQLKATQPEASA